MIKKVHHEVGLPVLLSAEVPVESCGLPSKAVGLMLVVVALQVHKQAGSHVLVIGTRSKSGEQTRASQLVEPSSDEPAG